MIRNLAVTTAAFAMIAGFAAAQEAQTTTSTQATTTTGAPDINVQAAQARDQARANAKPGEQYEWSVDSTTVKTPVHPTVIEKTTVVTPQAPVVNHHESTTTTTTTGDQ